VIGMTGWHLREGDDIAPGLRVVRPIGGGLRYETYLAWADHLRALVVVKAVRPELVGDDAAMAGLRGEARALRRLAHPMLLRAFGEVLDGERPHLVLEFIEGPRLSTLIRRYGLTIEQVLPLGLNLCAVVHYLAHEGVLHLDVKPRNIIMAGEPRLIDLSIARPVSEIGSLTGPVGTDAYMAPEQCDPDRFGELGPPADVWGIGVTLHEALSRRHVFPDDGARFPQLRTAPRQLPNRVPSRVAGAVTACLEPRPADRPTAAELASLLEPMVDALPAPRLGRFRPTPKRRRSIHNQEVPA
jgi:eukaryotic-like serine/threonine-protein kinase